MFTHKKHCSLWATSIVLCVLCVTVQYTALMFGVMSGSVAVVSLLLEAGAKPHATNKQGRTAAQTAAFVGELCSHRVA